MSTETMAGTAGLIALLTVLFDLIDIQPQTGSFAFMRTFTYLVFVLLRTFLGFAAALALSGLEPGLHPVILALVAVVANVTVLQSLSLKVGNQQLAQLAPLFENYKTKMVNEETDRREQRGNAEVLQVTQKLMAAPLSYLEVIVREMLLQAGRTLEDANKRIEEHKKAAGDPGSGTSSPQYSNYLASSYAVDIADMNLVYAKRLVNTRPWEWVKGGPPQPP